jgi:hypothetical protein
VSIRSIAALSADALVTLVALVSLAGCDRKAKECSAFIEHANKAQAVVGTLQFRGEDANKLEADAAQIDAEAKRLEAVPLEDPKLVKLRADYAANLQKLAKAVRDLAKLRTDAKPDGAAALAARASAVGADADAVEKAQTQIVSDINDYCHAPK